MKLTSSEPFWLVKNGIIHSYPSLRENIQADILIVGGGITGSLMAHQCIKDGYKTVLLDRREIGHGSTSATTSMLQYEIDTPLHKLIEMIGEKEAVESYWACHESIDELKKIVKKIKSKCGFKRKDSLYFAAFKKDIPDLKKEFEARKQFGFKVKWMEAEEIEQKYHLKNAHAGILSKQGASIDAFQLAHDIMAFNVKKGLNIYDKTEVLKVENTSAGIKAYTDYENTVEAKHVIYCNGFEATEQIKEKFVKLLSTYAIVGERNEDDQTYLHDTLFWNTADPYIYMRTTDDNRLLIGGEDEEFLNTAKRDALLPDKELKLNKYIRKIFPNYDFRTDFGWAGTFGETKDGLPYIGVHPDFPCSFFVLGFGGNGITFSVIGMEMISNMLKGKSHSLEKVFGFGR